MDTLSFISLEKLIRYLENSLDMSKGTLRLSAPSAVDYEEMPFYEHLMSNQHVYTPCSGADYKVYNLRRHGNFTMGEIQIGTISAALGSVSVKEKDYHFESLCVNFPHGIEAKAFKFRPFGFISLLQQEYPGFIRQIREDHSYISLPFCSIPLLSRKSPLPSYAYITDSAYSNSNLSV